MEPAEDLVTGIPLDLSDDDLSLIKRGLHGLHNEIVDWSKSHKTLFIRRNNPHSMSGKERLAQIDNLLARLEVLEPKAALVVEEMVEPWFGTLEQTNDSVQQL